MSKTDLIRRLPRPQPAAIPASVEAFLAGLGGPAWIEVPGRDHSRKRLVVTLLHGNEPSGIRAMHAWLRSEREPEVDTVLYIGSVAAALAAPGFAHRALPGERDANRCYGVFADDLQGRIARDFTALFGQEAFEAVIDIHNNTGHNPAYAIGYGVDAARLNLANLFADWFVDSDLCMHTLVEMTEQRCPSISVECGRAGDPAADAAALAGLDRFLHLSDLGLTGPMPRHLQILHHPRRVCLRPQLSVVFADAPAATAGLTLRNDLDRHNFQALDAGTLLGWVQPGQALPLSARGAADVELAQDLFVVSAGELRTLCPMIPIMMTSNADIARSDCLFYAMDSSGA